MTEAEVDLLLAEQMAYYRARAAEYDETSPVATEQRSRATLAEALEAFTPAGRVLELACGTGQWTGVLAKRAAALTAIDSSPEMLAIAAERVRGKRVRFIQADIFQWQPRQQYDLVFFSAWLSHVPPQRFERFWLLVAQCLAESGQVFLIDELPVVQAHEHLVPDAPAPSVLRRLNSGERYRIVKVFYEPGELHQRLHALGWESRVHQVGWRFFYATSWRTEAPPAR